MSKLYIGLISGTSMDGVDAVLVDFTGPQPHLVSSLCYPYPLELRRNLQALSDETVAQGEINLMGKVDRQAAEVFAEAVMQLCHQAGVTTSQIAAIGCHGQTIRHYPVGQHGFTLQICDGNTLAVKTGIDVIADFRRMDIALGGQGAPLVPAFHRAVFASSQSDRFIVNLGGIANLTFLPKDLNQKIIGFDTGPANTLSDQWIQRHSGQTFDNQGQWAATGQCNHNLLSQLLQDDYFNLPAPKSTGREQFNLKWLDNHLKNQTVAANDVQNTLLHLSAKSLATEIQKYSPSGEIYLCGGGSHNVQLVNLVKFYLPDFKVSQTNALGIDPDWVEAMAFAWLARAYQLKIPGNIPSVTGASGPAILGCMYVASKNVQ